MDFLVAAHRIAKGHLALREAWRIENDEIKLLIVLLGVLEIIEAVLGARPDANSSIFRVLKGCGDSAFAYIHGNDFTSSGKGTGLGKSTLIGKAIQDAAAFGELGDMRVVVELVKIKPSLLAFE